MSEETSGLDLSAGNDLIIQAPRFPANQAIIFIEESLEKLAEKYAEVPADLSIKENYKYVKDATSLLRNLRGKVEKRRKSEVSDAVAWQKKVNEAAKLITSKLVEIETPFLTAKKEFDTAKELAEREAALLEERRFDAIVERIASIKATPDLSISRTSVEISASIIELRIGLDQINSWAGEYAEKATLASTESIAKLESLFALKVSSEESARIAAEAEAKRKADEELARIEAEKLAAATAKKLAEERALFEAEKAKLEAEKLELKRKQDEAAKIIADQEKERAEKAKKDKEESDRLAAAAAKEVEKEKAKLEADRLAFEKLKQDEAAAQLTAKEDEQRKFMEAEAKQLLSRFEQPVQPSKQASTTLPRPDEVAYKNAGQSIMNLFKTINPLTPRTAAKAALDAIINDEILNVSFNQN